VVSTHAWGHIVVVAMCCASWLHLSDKPAAYMACPIPAPTRLLRAPQPDTHLQCPRVLGIELVCCAAVCNGLQVVPCRMLRSCPVAQQHCCQAGICYAQPQGFGIGCCCLLVLLRLEVPVASLCCSKEARQAWIRAKPQCHNAAIGLQTQMHTLVKAL
jgi:hypothetical protein